jgi:hypothetical protein
MHPIGKQWGAQSMVCVGAILGSAAPCLAGPVIGVPGPVAAVGLPGLAVLGGVFWLCRKVNNRSQV